MGDASPAAGAWLELRVPPPVVGAVAALSLEAARRIWPDAALDWILADWLAILLLAVGLACEGAGFLAFRRARTTINPLHPERTTQLVDSGIYRKTRNPMYVGLMAVLGAWALHLGHAAALAILPLTAAWLTRFQIVPEERLLAARFGESYAAYRRRVPRWL